MGIFIFRLAFRRLRIRLYRVGIANRKHNGYHAPFPQAEFDQLILSLLKILRELAGNFSLQLFINDWQVLLVVLSSAHRASRIYLRNLLLAGIA